MLGRESNSRLVDHKSDALTTAPPSHLNGFSTLFVGAVVMSDCNIASSIALCVIAWHDGSDHPLPM